MRSGMIKALHDDLIRKLINDPKFEIREDGTIWTFTSRQGRPSERSREAGRYDSDGYIQISYRGQRIFAHRIVYQKFNGSLQSDLVVDHVNQIRDDNRPENLKLMSIRANNCFVKQRKEERNAKKKLSA